MTCESLRLLNVSVTQLQRNQRGDPDSGQSRFEGSVLARSHPTELVGRTCCSRQEKPQKETRITRILSIKNVVPSLRKWFVAEYSHGARIAFA